MILFSIPILIFIIFSLPIIIEDFKSMLLNSLYIYIGTALSIVVLLIIKKSEVYSNILSALFEFIFFLILYFVTNKKLGTGDIKYSLFCGLICGTFYKVLFSCIIASIAGLLFFLIKKIKEKDISTIKLPFTPFMFLGTLIIYFF